MNMTVVDGADENESVRPCLKNPVQYSAAVGINVNVL